MAISMIIVISLIILFVFVGVVIASVKNEQNEGGEDVIKHIYVYLVLFATLMMVIGGSVSAFMAVADIVAPAPYYQSFEDYKRFEFERKESAVSGGESPNISEEELRERYDALVKAEREKEVNRAKNSLIKSFGWIIIPLPVFIYFQKNLVNKKGV